MPKNILHIIDTTGPGGAETVFTQLAEYSQIQGFKTLALIRGPGWVETELGRLGIQTYIQNCKGSVNVKFLWYLIRLIRSEKIDIIHSHLLGSNVYASLAGLITGIRVITTFHGFVDISASERFTLAKFLSIRFGSKHVVAVTQPIKDMLQKTTPIPPEKISVIANGIDTQLFLAKTNYALSNGRPAIIGCLGNVRTAKNYPLAIQVLSQLTLMGINTELHIAGDNTNRLTQECIQLANELGVSDRVVWHGFISNAAEYLTSLDVFLLSSSTEGHPLALTQAMSTGLPIVATRCGVEQVVTSNYSALLAENNNCESIVQQICTLVNDDHKREQLGQNAAQEARQKWSITQMMKSYQELYEL